MDRAEYSSIFGFDSKITIVSYVPKPNHAVLALSTTHHDMQTEGEKNKNMSSLPTTTKQRVAWIIWTT